MSFSTLLQIVTVIATGLIAGLFYGYECSVNKGLGKLPAMYYLSGFQSINRAILNLVFFSTFVGSAVLLLICTIQGYGFEQLVRFYIYLAAFLIYLIAVFGVTMAKSVPLNEKLDKFNLHAATETELNEMRKNFEQPWNKWNSIRTAFSIITFLLTVITLILQ